MIVYMYLTSLPTSKILYVGFRATLKFWKFKVALNLTYGIF